MKKWILFFLLLGVTLQGATRAQFNLSNLDLEAGIDFDVGQLIESYGKDTYFIGAGFLTTNDGAGYQMVTANVYMESEVSNFDAIRMGFGLKLVMTQVGANSFLAVPVGMHVDYRVPNTNELLLVTGKAYYAPAPLSIGAASSYIEGRIGVAVEPVENMRGFVEYRVIFTNFDAIVDPFLFNSTLYIGARVGF
ncbi:MAG: hypothetical protein KU37_05180 [Sulfuricurvum sp. PC08-66]|nr:MAG: hypothetical protein KU37_05180 [Sulfuricurvum sp. PC08-66]